MKIKSQKDFWSGLMFLVVGLAFAWGATYYSFGTSARPGPGYFPLGLGSLLAALGALTLFEALTIETEDGEPIGGFAWKPLCDHPVGSAAVRLAAAAPGHGADDSVLVIISSFAGDEFHWRGVIISSVVLAIGSWIIFILGLKLVIPLWPTFLPFAR